MRVWAMFSKRTRKEIEDRISLKEKQIQFSETDVGWIHSQVFREYLAAWKEFVNYYLDQDKTILSITFQPLISYLRTTRLLNLMLRRPELTQHQEELEEILAELEDRMDTIINEGFARMYSAVDKPEDNDEAF
jgi:hypothetical protein